MDVGALIWLGVVLLIIAIVAFALGARGVAGMTASVGRTVLVIGLILGIVLILIGALTGRGGGV